jgi:eukaryotic-like serine/threonine-protein kinase
MGFGGRDGLAAGRRLGRYELLLPIADGGMARVWAARVEGSRGLHKIVAVKTMSLALAGSEDPQFERMFLDEADLASRIRHRNVVEILERGEDDGVIFLAMEWIDGDSLLHVMRPRGRPHPLAPSVAARIVADAASGLHAAHGLCDENGRHLGLVHRDVSPQNILIGRDGTVKVTDFGVAKALGRGVEATRVGELKGKPSYMSPEQVRGKPVDRRSDVFALGVVLFEAVTGARPFVGDNEIVIVQAIATGQVTPPTALAPDCPAEVEAIILTALATDPDRRFQDAQAMSLALEGYLTRAGALMTAAHVAAALRALSGPRMDALRERIHAAAWGPGEAPPPRSEEATDSIHAILTPSAAHLPALPAPAPPKPAPLRAMSVLPWIITAVALAVTCFVLLVPRPPRAAPSADLPPSAAASVPVAVSAIAPAAAPALAASAVPSAAIGRPPIALDVKPESAVVRVGGKFVGRGPQTIARPEPGASVTVDVSMDDYASSSIELDPGSPDRVSVELTPMPMPIPASAPEVAATAAVTAGSAPARPRPKGPPVAIPKNPY